MRALLFAISLQLGLFAGPPTDAPADAPEIQRPKGPEVLPDPSQPKTPPATPPATAPATTPETPAPAPEAPATAAPPAASPSTPPDGSAPPVLPPLGGESVAPPVPAAPEPAATAPAATGPGPTSTEAPQVAAPPTAASGPPDDIWGPAYAPPPEGAPQIGSGVGGGLAPTAAAGPPAGYVERPRYRGVGQYITAGLFGAAALGFKITTTVVTVRNARGGVFLLFPEEDLLLGGIFGVGPFLATAVGTYAGARKTAAKSDAYEVVYEGKAPRKLRTKLGWGLFGGGMALWGITRLAYLVPCSSTCRIATLETGYYLSLPMTFVGLHYSVYGSVFGRNKWKYEQMKSLNFAPLYSRGSIGVQLSGRF